MTRYPEKNPSLTDAEYEVWLIERRVEAMQQIQRQREEPTAGDFMGYWDCPVCHARRDMIRPVDGDLVMTCDSGHTETIPILRSGFRAVAEGELLP